MPLCAINGRRVRDCNSSSGSGSGSAVVCASSPSASAPSPPLHCERIPLRSTGDASERAPSRRVQSPNNNEGDASQTVHSTIDKRTAQVAPLSPLAAAAAAATATATARCPVAAIAPAAVSTPIGMGHSSSTTLPRPATLHSLAVTVTPTPIPPPSEAAPLHLPPLQVHDHTHKQPVSTLSTANNSAGGSMHSSLPELSVAVAGRSGSSPFSSAASSAASSATSTPIAGGFTSPMQPSMLSTPPSIRQQPSDSGNHALVSNALLLPPAALQTQAASHGAPRHLTAEASMDEAVGAGSVSSTSSAWTSPPPSQQQSTAAELQRRVEVLRSSLFGHLSLPPTVLSALAVLGHSVTFVRGEALFRRGEVADCLFVIEEGQVCVEAQASADPRSSASAAVSPCSSPSAPLRRTSMLGLRGQVLPPIASSGFLASRARRMSAPAPLPLSSIRECPVMPIRILRSNLSSEAPLVSAEEDRAQAAAQTAAAVSSQHSPLSPISPSEESASPTASPREVGFVPSRESVPGRRRTSTRRQEYAEAAHSKETATFKSAAGSTSPAAVTSAPSTPPVSCSGADSTSPPTKSLVLKGVGDVLGGESVGWVAQTNGGAADASLPLPKRSYVTRCHSERVQLLVISYVDFNTKILPLLQQCTPNADGGALCRLLSHEWLAGALRSLSCLRALPQASMLLLASLFRPVFLPAHSVLFKAGEPYALDSSAFVLYQGEVVVTEAEEIDSPGPGPAPDTAAAAGAHPHSQLVQRGACVGESALFFSAGTPRRLSIGGGGDQSPAQSQAGGSNSAAAAAAAATGRTLVSAPTGTRSGTARTTRPCVLFQLSRRAYVACVDFLIATGGDVQGSPTIKQPVPTLATIQMQQQAEAAAAAAAGAGSPISPGGVLSPNGGGVGGAGSPVPSARPSSLSKYSDADLLLHPLFQKVFYVFCQQERPSAGSGPGPLPGRGQHELLEFWRDAVNFRTGYNKAQLSVGEEAAILHRAYILRSAAKHMAHLDRSIQDRISAVVAARNGSGCGSVSVAGSHHSPDVVDRYLFLDAERSTESVIVSGPLARFKCSTSFYKIAPFVKIDPKMLRKNEQMRRSLTEMAANQNGNAGGSDAARGANINGSATAAAAATNAGAAGVATTTGDAAAGLHRVRLHRANSVPDYVHVGMASQPQTQTPAGEQSKPASSQVPVADAAAAAAAAPMPRPPASPATPTEGRHRSRSATDPSGAHSAAMVFQSERQRAELIQQPEAGGGGAGSGGSGGVASRHGSDGTLVAAGQRV